MTKVSVGDLAGVGQEVRGPNEITFIWTVVERVESYKEYHERNGFDDSEEAAREWYEIDVKDKGYFDTGAQRLFKLGDTQVVEEDYLFHIDNFDVGDLTPEQIAGRDETYCEDHYDSVGFMNYVEPLWDQIIEYLLYLSGFTEENSLNGNPSWEELQAILNSE